MVKKVGQVMNFQRVTPELSLIIVTLLVLKFRWRTYVPPLTGPHHVCMLLPVMACAFKELFCILPCPPLW